MILSRSSAVRPSDAMSTSYSASASVFDSRSRIVDSSSTTSTRGRPAMGAGAGRGVPAARPLRLEPRVDVALAEPPLASHAHRGDLARLDEAVHRSQVDLKVLEDLFGREKALVHHDAGDSALTLSPSAAGADGSSMW